jgi:hypothetical protein
MTWCGISHHQLAIFVPNAHPLMLHEFLLQLQCHFCLSPIQTAILLLEMGLLNLNTNPSLPNKACSNWRPPFQQGNGL